MKLMSGEMFVGVAVGAVLAHAAWGCGLFFAYLLDRRREARRKREKRLNWSVLRLRELRPGEPFYVPPGAFETDEQGRLTLHKWRPVFRRGDDHWEKVEIAADGRARTPGVHAEKYDRTPRRDLAPDEVVYVDVHPEGFAPACRGSSGGVG